MKSNIEDTIGLLIKYLIAFAIALILILFSDRIEQQYYTANLKKLKTNDNVTHSEINVDIIDIPTTCMK